MREIYTMEARRDSTLCTVDVSTPARVEDCAIKDKVRAEIKTKLRHSLSSIFSISIILEDSIFKVIYVVGFVLNA